MPVVTVTDLTNAKTDANDLSSLVNGFTSVETRTGGTKQSYSELMGLVTHGTIATYDPTETITTIDQWRSYTDTSVSPNVTTVYRPIPSALPISPTSPLETTPNTSKWLSAAGIKFGDKIVYVVESYAEIRAYPSASIPDGAIFKVNTDGIAGDFIVKRNVASPNPISDNGGTLLVFNDDSNRYVERLVKDAFNVMWFSANADGTTDDKSIINSADVAAAAAGKALFFPENTYAVSVSGSPSALTATTSWFSVGSGAVLKNTNLALASDTEFIRVQSQSDLTFEKIHIDGQITTTGSGTANQDHATPSDSNIDDYTRCAGWNIVDCTDLIIKDCRADNIYRASFRSQSSSTGAKNISFINCFSTRNRGTFGDPFYSQYVRDVKYINCHCYDYTRIGFVYEGVAGSNQATDFTSFTGCYAEYAHDNYSGENSCGYWVENCQEFHMDDCHAVNTVGGFVLSSTDSAGRTIPNDGQTPELRTYNMTNCTAASVKAGLNLNPDDKDAVFNISNFNANLHGQADVADLNGTASHFTSRSIISAKIGSTDTVINITNSGGYIKNGNYSSTELYGFFSILQPVDTTTQKIINLKNCTLKFENPAKVRTDASSGSGKGFFHSNGSHGCEIHFDNCSELGATDDMMSVSNTAYDDKGKFYFTGCRPQIIKWSGRPDYLEFKDCEMVDVDVQSQVNEVRLSNSQFNYLGFTTNNWKMYCCDGAQLNQTTVDPHTRYDGFKAVGCNFNGNLNIGDTCNFTVSDSREWRAIFQNCTFHDSNKGAATSYHFIVIDTSYGFVAGTGNLIDNAITNYMERNAVNFSAPKTDVDADMPFGIFTALDA